MASTSYMLLSEQDLIAMRPNGIVGITPLDAYVVVSFGDGSVLLLRGESRGADFFGVIAMSWPPFRTDVDTLVTAATLYKLGLAAPHGTVGR